MCCLFGIVDYGRTLTRKQKARMLSTLAIACEARGTDATGIAYNSGGHLHIFKRPQPAHAMRFYIPDESRVIMGHTRMTTQGSEKKNYNNHPFYGSAGGQSFALAHNGVLYNDRSLQISERLPVTQIETDSYVAVQLLEKKNALSLDSLRYMAEQVEGSFTFTALSEDDRLYFVKGENPICIYHYPKRKLYLYASTEEILKDALEQMYLRYDHPRRILMECGDILCIDKNGAMDRAEFNTDHLLPYAYPRIWSGPNASYRKELKSIARYYGYDSDMIDAMFAEGFTAEEVEDLLYCGGM